MVEIWCKLVRVGCNRDRLLWFQSTGNIYVSVGCLQTVESNYLLVNAEAANSSRRSARYCGSAQSSQNVARYSTLACISEAADVRAPGLSSGDLVLIGSSGQENGM